MIQKRTTEPSKNSVHAPWIHAAGILTALWLMIVFLITAVEAVAYWTPGYYKMEYEKYQVLDDLPEMTMDDLLSVTDEMMAYLRGNRRTSMCSPPWAENTGSFSMPGRSPTWRTCGGCS